MGKYLILNGPSGRLDRGSRNCGGLPAYAWDEFSGACWHLEGWGITIADNMDSYQGMFEIFDKNINRDNVQLASPNQIELEGLVFTST